MPSHIKTGAVAAGFILVSSALFGTVNPNDIHRLNDTVDNTFFLPEPGKMFEVVDGSASPICGFDNAEEAKKRDESRIVRYFNYLGIGLPVAPVLSRLFDLPVQSQMVRIDLSFYTEGLPAEFEAELSSNCEKKAQEAYNRGSVVCIVDNVVRDPDSDVVIGVRFKRHVFLPFDPKSKQMCPLTSPKDVFWPIRKIFISTTNVSDATQEQVSASRD